MTREDARKMLPIMQAFAEGKEIEYCEFGTWVESVNLGFIFPNDPNKYRIKSESKN